MLLDKEKYTESAYIGEELFSDAEKDSLHTLMVAERTISDGDFSLEEALEAYKIDKSTYEEYLARKTNANISFSISGTNTDSHIQVIHFEVLSKAFDQFALHSHHNFPTIYFNRVKKEMDKLLEKMEKHNVKA